MNKDPYIFGGSGTVGRNFSYGTKVSSKDCNLINSAEVDVFFANNKIDKIINCAAVVGGLGYHLDPNSKYELLYNNVMINTNVIHYARKHNIKRVLSYLSSCVYSDECPLPYTEKMIYSGPPAPVHLSYAVAKRLLSVQSQICHDEGLQYSSLIPINIYGPHDQFNPNHSHFVAALILRAFECSRDGGDFIVWGTGSQKRQLIYVEDMVNITTWLLDNYFDREPIIVCPPNNYIEIGYIAELIAKEFNIEKQLKFDPTKPIGQKDRILSGDKLASIYKYNFITPEEGIKKTISWFLSNYPNIRL